MIGRLGGHPAGRLALQVASPPGPHDVESTFTCRTINPAASARACRAAGMHPGALRRRRQNDPWTPCREPWRAITSRHDTPLRTLPVDPIDQLPFAPRGRSTRPLLDGQQRLQDRPPRVGQVEPPGHRWSGHEVSPVQGGVLGKTPSTGDLTAFGAQHGRSASL